MTAPVFSHNSLAWKDQFWFRLHSRWYRGLHIRESPYNISEVWFPQCWLSNRPNAGLTDSGLYIYIYPFIVSRKIIKCFLLGDQWWKVLGFVPTAVQVVSQAPNSLDLQRRMPLLMLVCPSNYRPALSFLLTWSCPGQYVHGSLWKWMVNMVDASVCFPFHFLLVNSISFLSLPLFIC